MSSRDTMSVARHPMIRNTLEVCGAWEPQRHDLSAFLGTDQSLPVAIAKMFGSGRCWSLMASFCVAVIARKEETEREREALESADSGGGGDNMRSYSHRLE